MTQKRMGKVPKLRFPEFRDSPGWKKRRISKLLIEQTRPVTMGDEEEYSLVTVKRRYGGVVSRGMFKGKSIKVKSQYLLHENDFLISKRQIVHNACGIVPKELEGSIVSNEYAVLKARPDVIIEFFNYFAQQPALSKSFLLCSIGIVIEKMLFKLPHWLRMEFPFPPPAEQQKIADCLSSIDKLIAAHTQKLDALKKYKKGLMQQLFLAEGETTPKLRFSEFRDAPEWEKKQLSQICQMQAGKFVSASEIHEMDAEELHPCYGGNGLRGYTKTYTHTGKYTLVGRQGALCGNVRLASGKFHATEHAVVSTPKDNVKVAWLFYLLVRLNLNQYATGQAQPGLSIDNLEKLPVFVPATTEQEKVANFLSSLDDLITAQTQKIASLKAHKKGLMQQLFPSVDEANG